MESWRATAMRYSLPGLRMGRAAAAPLVLALQRCGRLRSETSGRPPRWAFPGGLSGAVTVIVPSTAVNSTSAIAAGVLVGISRQLNGRLSQSGGGRPMPEPFWNHAVGFMALSLLGEFPGGRLLAGAAAPWRACLGRLIGVLFIAVSSWVVVRIGAGGEPPPR